MSEEKKEGELNKKLKELDISKIINEEVIQENLKFLEDSNLLNIVIRGMAELYRIQPENPITFLSNFLINESYSNTIKEKICLKNRRKEELKIKKAEEKEYLEKQFMEQQAKEDEKKAEIEQVKKEIIECPDYEDGLNDICEHIKKLLNLTGVYISSYEVKRVPIPQLEADLIEKETVLKENEELKKKLEEEEAKKELQNEEQGEEAQPLEEENEEEVKKTKNKNTDESKEEEQKDEEQKTDEKKEEEEEFKEPDENSHLDPEGVKALRFIHWCNDHAFLKDQIIEPNKGVTYPLFMTVENEEEEGGEAPPEDNKNEGEEGAEEEEKDDTKKDEVKSVIINDVVNNNKIIFFREPRLGAFIGYNLTYDSSMSYKSLLSALENKKEYDQRIKERDEKKKETEGEEGEENEEKDNAPEEEEGDENKEEGEEGEESKPKKEEEKIEEKDYEKEEKTIILSVDTLGQDRTLSDNELNLMNELAKLIRDSIFNHEKELLLKDREKRLQFLAIEQPLAQEWTFDKIYAEQEGNLRGNPDLDAITDEISKGVYAEYIKANMFIEIIQSTELLTALKMFSEMEIIQYEKIFQNILYFYKIDPEDINEDQTYKLKWKKAKIKWDEILTNYPKYTPLGPKPEKVRRMFKGDKILAALEPYVTEEKIEELNEYSFSLGFLVQYIVNILRVRKKDILARHNDQRMKIKERKDIIKENKKIDEDKMKELKKAKRVFEGKGEEEEEEKEENEGEEKEKEEGDEGEKKEDEEKKEAEEEEEEEEEETEKKPKQKSEPTGENIEPNAENQAVEAEKFNEEEFLAAYEEQHPKKPVPPAIKIDIDNDFDLGNEDNDAEEAEEEPDTDKDKSKDE